MAVVKWFFNAASLCHCRFCSSKSAGNGISRWRATQAAYLVFLGHSVIFSTQGTGTVSLNSSFVNAQGVGQQSVHELHSDVRIRHGRIGIGFVFVDGDFNRAALGASL